MEQGYWYVAAVIIVIVIILLWIYWPRLLGAPTLPREEAINQTLAELRRRADLVCQQCGMHPLYEIVPSAQVTSTEKITTHHNVRGLVNLVVWNEQDNRPYGYNTLTYALLHELTHVLSPSPHHEPPFDTIEDILLTAATALGFYDKDIPLDPNYLTIELQ